MCDRAWPCHAPCFSFDDFPSTVGDRDGSDLLLMRTPPEMGVRWAKQGSHTSQIDGFVCEVKSLQWQRRQGLHDATA